MDHLGNKSPAKLYLFSHGTVYAQRCFSLIIRSWGILFKWDLRERDLLLLFGSAKAPQRAADSSPDVM